MSSGALPTTRFVAKPGQDCSGRHYGWPTGKAQQIAGHESPKTTKLYDRTSDQITLDEIERIAI
jgi:hypothetical protein